MSVEEKSLFENVQEMITGVPPNATNPREDILVKKPQHNTTQKKEKPKQEKSIT
jgi:hypothetical protein